jgi:hypothetical protein
MRKLLIPLVLAGVFLVAIFAFIQKAHGQNRPDQGDQATLSSETEGENTREIYAPAGQPLAQDSSLQPDIGFIDSPTAVCYQPVPGQDTCYINWYYLSVSASPNYIISMTVKLNAFGIAARSSGFFQTSMYIPYNMLGQGFKVACGPKGAGGNPDLGNAYSYTIRARDSAGLSSANYGTVYCPFKSP